MVERYVDKVVQRQHCGDGEMAQAEDLLSEHGLDRDIAIAYIDAAIRQGPSEVADEVQLPQQTVDRCRAAFESMGVEERVHLIASLFDEWRQELVQEHLPEEGTCVDTVTGQD